ncbi:hypothetical protein MHZ95_12535 [Sporosarcina sp. ACRSM]|uniref:hypothetical protein n=1 Tax=Sporosarcina sp. ACRSM TaxID=2918216 RepID=UPI001EF54BF4|nr:hypothetical protein [Sporosarcina sp. ACRSM]MCG7336091.1 hypothetical protein [Sporosarcina sp. ACRSM]
MLTQLQTLKAFIQNQIHERFSYSISYEEQVYNGLYDNAFMNWFNPKPFTKVEIQEIQQVKRAINAKMHHLI